MYTSALPILHAEERSGVTLHKIDSGIDTGDILCQKAIMLSPSETAKSLYKKYIQVGTDLVVENIDSILMIRIQLYHKVVNILYIFQSHH